MIKRTFTALAVSALIAGPAASAGSSPASSSDARCNAVFDRAAPAARQALSERGRAAVRTVVSETRGLSTAEALQDKSIWIDTCGDVFYVDNENSSLPEPDQAEPLAIAAPLDQTFELESLPGANKTIYLDFTGRTLSNTGWNETYGPDIEMPTYSRDSNSAFSAAELTHIQQAYLVVAEDYAPFGVNVTTKKPAASALEKSSSSDPIFGVTALVSSESSIGAECSCGGVAYLDITRASPSVLSYYSPALVFSENLFYDGRYMGEAISHEIGHNLGLSHDGELTSAYYSGTALWGPIMGSAYNASMSQWSKGEYFGASNTQDDLSIIHQSFPRRAQDNVATPINSGSTTKGILTSASEVDSFTFNASGTTVLEVIPTTLYSNLDVLGKLYRDGQLVSTFNPASSSDGPSRALGTGFRFEAALEPGTYVLEILPTGSSSSQVTYSSYGSLGQYTFFFSTESAQEEELPDVSFQGQAFTIDRDSDFQTQLEASGGDGTYQWSHGDGLPTGLSLSSQGFLSGRPTTSGSYSVDFTASSGAGNRMKTRTEEYVFTVNEPVVAPPPAQLSHQGNLTKAFKGKSYKATFFASGGTSVYSWRLKGTRPPGLKWKVTNGGDTRSLVGRPKATGRYRMTVLLTSGTEVKRKTFTLVVKR